MKGFIIKEVEIKESHSTNSNTLSVLPVGAEIEIIKPRIGTYENPWVYVQYQDELIGYIKQESLIEVNSKYTLVISKSDIFSEASNNSLKVFVLPNQAQIIVTEIVINESGNWYKITDSLGRSGYMHYSDEIELTRELVDYLSKNRGGMLSTFANAGIIGGVVLIIFAVFRLIYVYNSSNNISAVSILLIGVGILAIILDIVRKRRKKYD